MDGKIIIVNQGHCNASDQNHGTEDFPYKTINAAASVAFLGDTVLVHSGIYREEVVPQRSGEVNKPITFRAAKDETVYIRGSEVFNGKWIETSSPGIYCAMLDRKHLDLYNPYKIRYENITKDYFEKLGDAAPKHTLGQVFLDGIMLMEVDNENELKRFTNTWLAGKNGDRIYVHFQDFISDLSKHMVEYTVRKAVFRPEKRGLSYITVSGFIMEHAANQGETSFWMEGFAPQQGLFSFRSGHHWVVENNTIRYAKAWGMDIGSERWIKDSIVDGQPHPGLVGYNVIKNNVISDNGQGGLNGLGHIGTQIIGNVFERNNNLGSVAWEEAAIKTHFYINGFIEGNVFKENYCTGIWLDNVYQNIRITKNVILGNRGAGIFCEMGKGPCLIDNNIIGHSLKWNPGIGGNGIYAHDAGGMKIFNNYISQNSQFGVYCRMVGKRDCAVYPEDITSFETPEIGNVPCHINNNTIMYNIFEGNSEGAVNLPFTGEYAQNNRCECNLYCNSKQITQFVVNNTGSRDRHVAESIISNKSKELPDNEICYHVSMLSWQEIMNMDKNSTTAELTNAYWQSINSGNGDWLTFSISNAALFDKCADANYIESDFYGEPIPANKIAAGPFQELHSAGYYRFNIDSGAGGRNAVKRNEKNI